MMKNKKERPKQHLLQLLTAMLTNQDISHDNGVLISSTILATAASYIAFTIISTDQTNPTSQAALGRAFIINSQVIASGFIFLGLAANRRGYHVKTTSLLLGLGLGSSVFNVVSAFVDLPHLFETAACQNKNTNMLMAHPNGCSNSNVLCSPTPLQTK